jgi:hypothetical protein
MPETLFLFGQDALGTILPAGCDDFMTIRRLQFREVASLETDQELISPLSSGGLPWSADSLCPTVSLSG